MIVFRTAAYAADGRRVFPEQRVGDPPSAFAWMCVAYLTAILGLILA